MKQPHQMNENEIEHAKARLARELAHNFSSEVGDDVVIITKAAVLSRTNRGVLFRLVGPEGPDIWMPISRLTSFEIDGWGPVRGAHWLRKKVEKYISIHASRLTQLKGAGYKLSQSRIPSAHQHFWAGILEREFAPKEIVYQTECGEKVNCEDLVRSITYGDLEGEQWVSDLYRKAARLMREEAKEKNT